MLEYVDRHSRVNAPRRADLSGDVMLKTTAFLFAALVAAPAYAADLGAVPAKPAPAAATNTTLGFEISPDFGADPAKATYNTLVDGYVKVSISEALGNGFSVGSSLQLVDKQPSNTFNALLDGSLAYKFKLNDNFSVTGTGGLGYNWGATGVGAGTGQPFFYYYGSAALDDKIDSHWTWNIINARYRNGVGVAWFTPKVQTGVTYNIDSTDAIYANIGYGWKDTTGGFNFNPDKWNVAVGYKYSF